MKPEVSLTYTGLNTVFAYRPGQLLELVVRQDRYLCVFEREVSFLN